MTRNEFDRYYAATQMNTEGYSDDQINILNDRVFARVADLELEDYDTENTVKCVSDQEHNKF